MVGIVQFVSNGNEAADFPRYDELRQEIKNNNVKDLTVQFEGNAFWSQASIESCLPILNRKASPHIFLLQMPLSMN